MALRTQGTQVYIIDPGATGGPEVLNIGCVTSADGFGGGRDQIDVTCLEDQARSYEAGLINPGNASLPINYDPRNASHVRLHELYETGTKFDLAVGFSDGNAAPTLDSSDEFDLPATRTYLVVRDAYVSDFPVNFSQNAVVTSGVTIQLSGLKTIFPKT
jgi:hypothetical protein